MNKRKFIELYKENWLWITIVIWVLLVVFGAVVVIHPKESPAWLWLCFTIVFILVTAFLVIIGPIIRILIHKKELKDLENRIQHLKMKYIDYVDLVDIKVKEVLNKYNIDSNEVYIDKSFAYLISFSNKLEWTKNYRITGEPDSFIIASCLMYAIISTHVIEFEKYDETDSDLKKTINIELAMNCALEIISEPITYYEGNGVWVGAKHPKVIISIPKGLIKEEDLFNRIKNTIYTDDEVDNRTSIMQFSNLLHLIYLNSLNSQ